MGKVLSPEEFEKKNRGTLTKPYSSGGIGTGDILPRDFGKSELDSRATASDIDNLNDFRAENQPLSERWKNGVSKALINVPIRVADGLVTSTAAVLGGLGELGDAFVEGDNVQFSDFINNPISQAFDELSKDLQENMPVYRSDEYEQGGVGEKLGSSAFWADTMTDAASFMGASFLGGMGVAKGLGGLTKQALKLSKAKSILGELEAAGNLGSLTNKSELIKSIVASTYGGAAESGVEARQTYQDLLAKGATEEEAGAASNIGFITNMFLTTGANYLQFGKIFSKTVDESLDASRLISEGGKLKISELSKTQKAYNMLLNNGSDIVTEGGQEASQFVTSKFLENYYTGDDETRDDFFKSMVNAVSELKSSEGIESVLAGAVLGGLSTAVKKFAQRGQKSTEDTNLQQAVDNYNSYNIADIFTEDTKVLAGQFSRNLQAGAAIKQAVRNNDEFGADLIKATSFGDLVVTNLRVGKFEDLIQQLTDVKDSNVDEANDLFKSESYNKFTEDEKNAIAETAIEQAYKIKKSYEDNMIKYGKVISHEDIAKISINESVLDFAKNKEQEVYEGLKPLIDIKGEILSTYKSPKEIDELRSKNDLLTSTISSIKSDIKAKGKDYKGERDKDLELAINNSNDILKTIENSITDYEGSGQVSYKDKDGKEQIKDYNIDYKRTVVKEINKRLNNLKAAAERGAGDITEWQKYNKLLKDYVKLQKIKEDIIDARNKYAVDPAGYFAKVNSNIDKIKESKSLKQLFTTKSQPYKNEQGFVDKDSTEDLTIEKGLYYTRLGRQIYQKDSKGQRKLDNGKPVLTNLVQNRRKFIEVVDTFAKINPDTNRTEGWVKIKEGDTTKEIPVSSLNGQLNRAKYISGEGVETVDKMTEEEAFYYNYKDRIIQYQYRSTFSEPAKIIEGQLAYNYRGDLVIRYFDDKGYPKYTHALYSKDGKPVGASFEVFNNSDKGKFRLENSQYLKIYSEEESKKIKELIALKDRKKYFEGKLEKISDNKLPHEDIMLQESDEIKEELKSLKDRYNQVADKRTSPAKKLKKTIEVLDKKLSSIDNYAESLQKEEDKYTKFVENLDKLIEKNKVGDKVEYNEEREILMNRIQAERGKYSTYIKELTDSDEAFKQNKALYYEVLKELRQQYDDIINPDLLYDSEYFAGVIDAMPEYGIDLRFRNRELSTKDFQEIVNFVIEGNGDTVQSYNEDTQELKEVKLDVKQLNGVGNEDYSAKIERLDNIISNINTEATKALAKVRSSNRKEFSTEDTINSYDFYNDLINSIKRVERELSKDDSIFVSRTNLKISGYDDVFIGSDGNGIVISDKKTAEQGLTTTSPNINENFAGFPSNSSNENDKHQWVYQKFLNDNDVTDYYIEYKISDKVGTFTRDKSFDADRTQKAIVAQIIKKDGTELKLNSWGQEDANGAYLPITVLEAGSGKYRPTTSKGVSPAKYRETEEADLLREQLKTATEKAEIESLTEQIEALDKVVDFNLTRIQEERERILTVLESGKRFVSPVVGQSLGIKIPADDNEISKVLGNDYKEKIRDGKLKVVVVKDPEITIGSRKISPRLGSIIIHETSGSNPRIYFLKGRKLEMQDFFKITEEIKKFSYNEVNKVFTSDFRGFYNKIRSYVYWGSNNDINKQYDGKTLDETVNETEESAKQKLYSLRFKFGSNSQIVEYGNYIGKDDKGKPQYENKEISVSEIQSNEDFQEFITSKYKHFSSSLLSDYMVQNIMFPNKSPLGTILDKNFTINLQPKSNVQFQSQYITPSNELVTKFAEVVKKEIKQLAGTSNSDGIEFIEPSLRLSDSLSYDEGIKQIQVWTQEGYLNKLNDSGLDEFYKAAVADSLELQSKGESLASEPFAVDILGIENVSTSNGEDTTYTTKREFKSTAALNAFIQGAIKRNPSLVGDKKLTVKEQAIESNNIDDIFGTEGGEEDVDNNSASSLFGEDGSFMRYSKVLESQPKIRLSDLGINDFKNYFGVPFKVVDRLTKGVGFGVVRQASDDLSSVAYNIEVEENAPLGTEYHEKFHLFERALFNDKERKQIYNLYRKTTKSTVTDAEASELLAEEFRYYSIERVAKDKRLNGTALEKVLAFIENFIKGISELFSYKNSETMNKLFDMMYNDTIKTVTGKTIEQALSLKEVSTRLTSEEIRATQKFALLEYYKAFEKSVPNFNYIDFIINKDYNKKAKQTYARLNNFDVDNEVDGDNLVINHIIASMRIENPLLNAKFKDINNRKQFIEEFKAYFASVNKESLIAEDLLEDEFNSEDSLGGRGDAFETDPTSKNHIQGTPSFVKQLLNTIPGDTNYLGLQEHVDSNKLNIELVYLFEKADSSGEMHKLLRESGRREFLALADRLNSKSEASSTDKNYREIRISKLNSFYSSLRKQILSFTQVDVEDEGKVTIIDKNRNTLIEKSLYDFKNNFKASFPATTEVELAKELQAIESTTEYNFINKLGFTVDRRFINFLADNNLLTKFNDTVSKIRQRDFKDKKAVEKLLKDPTKLTNIRIIAELISNYKSDIIPVQVLSTDNKPMYAIINRSFLSKKHNELVKKFKDATIGSLESKIAKSKIIYNLGISSSEETQKSSKMTEKPSFIFHIANALDKEISPYINTGDKSSYFGFQGLASIVPGDVEITNEHYVEIFKEFFRQEFETFTKFKSTDEGKVMPKMKAFFAITQDILPQHKLTELIYDKELKYTNFNSLYDYVKSEFEEGVKSEADKANRKLKQSLIDNGIVTYDGKFNFIDNGSLSRRLITNPDQLVERLNLFFWESNMLQSKFIVGDIGIYGLDLAKRVPAGMATKTDGNYAPAVAKLLDTELKYSTNNIMFNKTDAKGELIFDALVIDDLYHNDEELGKLFKNYKETNLSDAMGFEHIDSIRFREIAEGTWTEEDAKIYQLDLEGKANLEDMHKWTMKKTQYFGSQLIDFSKDSEETMEVNTFYKMAVLPISRTLVSQSGSKTLRGIKKLMESNNVPLMMFDSANKISRKVGYKLYDENGYINTNKESVEKYKQTSYWKYYNTQQETHKKSKSQQTLGTQFSKQIFANILEGEGNLTVGENLVKSSDIINNIDYLHTERVDVTKKLLLDRLGVTEAKGGYKVASKEKLFKELKANLDQKDVSTALKQEIEELLLNGKGLDITVGSGSFEAVLTSIVNKLIIQPKKFGSPMAQAANIGYTQMSKIYQGKDLVKMDESMSNLEPLKFYQEGDDYMEVYLPNYFKTKVDVSTIDKRLLDLIGFRIPTQSPNSIERIRVKGFLPESYSNMIIVPAQITTKAGSDFDIDKLNLYFPNFTLDENGVPKYVEAFNNEIEYKDNSEKLKAIDNGIHENYLTILDSKEYREQMLQPNSDERIKELCRSMKLANTEDGQTRMFDMLGVNYHVSNKQGSQLGKNVLGQAALHSTDHIMAQVADIYLREQRPNFEGIEKVQIDDNTTTLATFRDIEGIRITDTISEMVNALVDVLKEPYIKYSGITEHNAATFFYMLRTGLTLKQVVHFFNHPFIRSYNRELAKRQFNSSVYNSTLHKNLVDEILARFKENLRTDENGNFIPNNQIIKITNTELEERASREYPEYNNFDYSIIKEFDRLFNAANKLNEFMRVSKFDTSGVGTSFGETRGMKFDFDKFEKNNDLGNGKSYIENWNNKFERNGQKTTLGAYKDVVDESVDYFNSLYTANSYTNFKTSLDTLLAGTLGKNRVSMYSKYVSDFATYVTQNYGSFPSDLIKKSKGNNTVAQRIRTILKGDNKVLKNNLFLNKLILDTSGEQHKLLLQGSASMNVYESEQLSTSFSELAYYDEHLANDIIKVGILQDGFSKSPYSFLQLVPIQYKLEQVQTYYSELSGVNVQDFDTKFKINNYKKALNHYYPPKGREFNQPDNTYTLGKKEANGKRAIYIKIDGKTYTINEFGVVKDREEDVIIGRDSLDYRTSILGKAAEVNAASEEFKNSFISNTERVKIQNCQ